MTLIKTIQTSDILMEKVASLIQEVNSTHRYSMSRIYGLYNEVFAVAEAPQSCASCLIRKMNQLKSWLADQSKENGIAAPKIEEMPSKKGRKPHKPS